MKILVINGPNLNLLGSREPEIYGSSSYGSLVTYIESVCSSLDICCECFQSNHEGEIVDKIQSAAGEFDGIVINPAAYTHTSIAILDALKAVRVPAVEVHLSDISSREAFRRVSYTARGCLKTFSGLGFEGYKAAIEYLCASLGGVKAAKAALPEDILAYGAAGSSIRALAAYGAARKAEIGEDMVFDFSLGNPSVPAPECVREAVIELINGGSEVHDYTPAAGRPSLRKAVSESLLRRFGASVPADNVFITSGASGALAICFRALLLPDDEVLAPAPYFPEYAVFVEAAGGRLVSVPPLQGSLGLDLDAIERAVTPSTKALILNSPNNPSGTVVGRETLEKLCRLLRRCGQRIGHDIFLICDEPYRELVYGGVEVPCVLNLYDASILCYSFSKSLSLPGERIGYIAVNGSMPDSARIFTAIQGAARALGHVNAPSMMQQVVERCLDRTADISVYAENRDVLYNGLRGCGFECVRPDGAFYIFMKCPTPDAKEFSEYAKSRYELLLVPGDDFGLGGYVRIAYCVSAEVIRRALPRFRQLAADYGLC